jgi:hypothetical protein
MKIKVTDIELVAIITLSNALHYKFNTTGN